VEWRIGLARRRVALVFTTEKKWTNYSTHILNQLEVMKVQFMQLDYLVWLNRFFADAFLLLRRNQFNGKCISWSLLGVVFMATSGIEIPERTDSSSFTGFMI
jgi:hypothetical protein